MDIRQKEMRRTVLTRLFNIFDYKNHDIYINNYTV